VDEPEAQVSRSPIARATSVAATALSTPPLSAQIAWRSPTVSRISRTASSMNAAGVQSPVQPQTR